MTEHAKEGKEGFDRNLFRQYTNRRTNEEEALQTTHDAATEDHLVHRYIFWTNITHSVVGLHNATVAHFLFNQLASKTAQLEAVKEQILITINNHEVSFCKKTGACVST